MVMLIFHGCVVSVEKAIGLRYGDGRRARKRAGMQVRQQRALMATCRTLATTWILFQVHGIKQILYI